MEASAAAASRAVDGEAHAAVRQYLGNALWLLLAYLLPRLGLAISVIVAARVLGAANFGVYGTAAAYAVVLSILASLGVQPLLIRELARSPERAGALLAAADLIKTAAAVVMMLVLFALAVPLGYGRAIVGPAAMLGVAYALAARVDNRAAWLQAQERMHIWTRASAIYGLVAGALGIALVLATRSVLWFCAAAVVGQLASLGWLQARAPLPAGARATAAEVRLLLRHLAPFAAAFIALTLHAKVVVLLLAHWRPAADVGVFVAGYRFVDFAQALVVVAVAAAYPRIVRNGHAGGARLMELLLLIALPLSAALLLARAPAVLLLFGDAYVQATPVVALLAISLPALALDVAGTWVLGAAGRMGLAGLLYAGAVVIDVVLCALWVPRFGATGAAAALLVSEWLLACGMLVALSAVRARPQIRALWGAGFVIALTATLSMVPDPTGGVLHAVVLLAAVPLVYGAARILPRSEWQLLSSVMRRPSGRAPGP